LMGAARVELTPSKKTVSAVMLPRYVKRRWGDGILPRDLW
jgi:hypothetical protein